MLKSPRRQSRLIADILSRIADRLDGTSLVLVLLYAAEQSDAEFDFSSLAVALGKPRATLRRLLEPLLVDGLVRARVDAKDRRRMLLHLDVRGHAAVEAYLEQIAALVMPVVQREFSLPDR